jgi:hypothetical protein
LALELVREDPVSMIMESVDEATELLLAAMELKLLLRVASSPVADGSAAELVTLAAACPVKTRRPSAADCACTAGVLRQR